MFKKKEKPIKEKKIRTMKVGTHKKSVIALWVVLIASVSFWTILYQRQKMNCDMTWEWLSMARIYIVICPFVTLIVGVTLYLRFHIQKMMWQIFGRILTH